MKLTPRPEIERLAVRCESLESELMELRERLHYVALSGPTAARYRQRYEKEASP